MRSPNFKSVITKTGKVMEIIYHVIVHQYSPWPGVGWFFTYILCFYFPPIHAHQGIDYHLYIYIYSHGQKISEPLINRIKEGCENISALLIL